LEKLVYGAYEISMDGKGRVLLPREVREFWSLAADSKLKITARPDGCLILLLPDIWEREIASFKEENPENPARRRYIEAYMHYTREEKIDNTGRLMLASPLRKFSGIEPGTKVGMITGSFDRFLLMSKEVWDRHEKEIKNDAADRLWEQK